MRLDSRMIIATAACFAALNTLASPLHAQRRGGGGGGARPSMGQVGGGGGRPSVSVGGGGGMSRPSVSLPTSPRPNWTPPSANRPSFGNVSQLSRPSTQINGSTSRPATRPSTPSIPSRPITPSGPGLGGFHPGGGATPSLPNTRPGAGASTRPAVNPPSNVITPTRPSPPGNIAGNRPNLGGTDRPTTLPGNVGSGPDGNRPSLGNLNRPTTLPGNVGGNRPDVKLPGTTRPGGSEISTRPVIGIGDKGMNIGNGNWTNASNKINAGNIVVGNTINIGNRGGNFVNTRPAWDHGYNNPGWGLGGNWAGNWHYHCINGHHVWYNGCWNHGYWGSSWYRPIAWVSVGWGLGRWTSAWGYGASYYNPYYVAPVAVATVPYDYSQPVIVNNYISSPATTDLSGGQIAQPVEESAQSLSTFDQGLAQFKSGAYQQALAIFDKSLKELPNDPVVHEVRALTLFALGQYTPAASSLNSLLSSAPGMDWTTMSSLYGNVDDYATQLRKLEAYCQLKPTDSAAHFVLAYHCLVIGSKDKAISALQVVVQNQPKDGTAKRMLDALVPPKSDVALSTGEPGKSTDLVGKWRAAAGSSTIELEITEASDFVWKATDSGQPAIELTGQLSVDNDALVLTNEAQGAMAGIVKSLGPDKWQFLLNGAPTTDPGLSFTRVGS